jgi:hypothetical protein
VTEVGNRTKWHLSEAILPEIIALVRTSTYIAELNLGVASRNGSLREPTIRSTANYLQKLVSYHSKIMSKHRPLVRPRPQAKHAQLHGGVHGLDPLTHRTQRFQPLPPPLGDPPYRFNLADHFSGITDRINETKKLVFHVVGDTGGIKDPEKQRYVAAEMKKDLTAGEGPVLFFHLGDVIYYNGETDQYYPQFYEPYDHYDAPIFSIPGNHDGDPLTPDQTSLDGWVRYFMTPQPVVDPLSQDAPRLTQTQPNVYFTLEAPYVTIVGLYTNVPEGGSVDSVQQQWFTNELAQADPNKALLVALLTRFIRLTITIAVAREWPMYYRTPLMIHGGFQMQFLPLMFTIISVYIKRSVIISYLLSCLATGVTTICMVYIAL